MKEAEHIGPSILLIEEIRRPDRQKEFCDAIAAQKSGSTTVVNHLIDNPEALKRAEDFRGTDGEETPEAAWIWNVSNADAFDIVLLHTSNAYASAFLSAHSLDSKRVILYSGAPSSRWKRPEGFAEPISDGDLLPLIAEMLEKWVANASVQEILEEIRGERLLREKLFAGGLLSDQLQTQDSGMAENVRMGMAALFKPYLHDGITVDAFVNKALRSLPLRVAAKAVLAPEVGQSELWSLIQHDSATVKERVAANDIGTERVAALLEEINQLLRILCRQKKSSKTS